MRTSVVLLVLCAIVVASPCVGQSLKAGAAKRVITPKPLLPISGGMGAPKQATDQKGDLYARAFVLQKGDTTVAIVGLDLLGFPSVLGDRVRAKVPRIAANNILIGSSHTHSAPDCYAFPDGKGGHTGDLKYMDFVCQKTVDAINEALDQLAPATMKIAVGEAKGKIAYNYYAPDLYDRRMGVIQALGENGKTIGTLVNYAIHPEVLGNERAILSPDLIGPLCEKLEAQAGGTAVFMNGAQGGMITADNRELNNPSDPQRAYWKDEGSWQECERIGTTMASEAMRLLSEVKPQTDPALYCTSLDVKFPVESDAMWAVVTLSPLKYPHDAASRSITARLNLLNIGSAQILTIPGEALPNIGFYLKRKMRSQHAFLFGLTNDAFGYILTKVDFKSFPRYDYVSRTSLGEMTGEILIDNALKLLEDSPAPDAIPTEAKK